MSWANQDLPQGLGNSSQTKSVRKEQERVISAFPGSMYPLVQVCREDIPRIGSLSRTEALHPRSNCQCPDRSHNLIILHHSRPFCHQLEADVSSPRFQKLLLTFDTSKQIIRTLVGKNGEQAVPRQTDAGCSVLFSTWNADRPGPREQLEWGTCYVRVTFLGLSSGLTELSALGFVREWIHYSL